jgi:hypothetical protein
MKNKGTMITERQFTKRWKTISALLGKKSIGQQDIEISDTANVENEVVYNITKEGLIPFFQQQFTQPEESTFIDFLKKESFALLCVNISYYDPRISENKGKHLISWGLFAQYCDCTGIDFTITVSETVNMNDKEKWEYYNHIDGKRKNLHRSFKEKMKTIITNISIKESNDEHGL